MTVEVTHDNFQASCYQLSHRTTETWIVNFSRVSDGRFLPPQRWLTRQPTEDELTAVLMDWIYEKAGAKEPEKVFCGAECGRELVPEANTDTEYQFDNALWIRFDGGYGMFVDPMREEYKIVICHECAHALCDQHPWIGKLLNPHGSHAHKTAYVEAHPDHYGWDYDHYKEEA